MVAHLEDDEVSQLVVRAVQQYHRIRSGWSWEQLEMLAIIEIGMNHQNPATRGYSYKVAGYAMKEGHGIYREMLTGASARESDEKLFKQIENLLK